jgi:hypothetical protein
MNAEKFSKWLEEKGACEEGRKAASGYSLKEAWEKCERPEWMLWIYERRKPNKKKCVQVAIFSAYRCIEDFEKKYPEDKRPRQAIEAAEKWVKKPTEKNRNAVDAAANAANAAAYAANAANAANAAASAANAANAAANAANAAAYAAASAANASYVANSAAERKAICDYIRSIIKIK